MRNAAGGGRIIFKSHDIDVPDRRVPVLVLAMVVDFGILGPFEVRVDGDGPVALGGPRQRALLAILVLHANELVSTERLVDLLWGEQPPATAIHAVQVMVSHLRALLGSAGERLVTRSPGYYLDIGADELDADRCERRYAQARSALIAHDAARASSLLREAVSLWRGWPLAEFTYEPFAQAPIARLAELRISCREELIEAELALGRHAEIVADLEALVREEPLRERPRAQLMLALYRCGRQADALAAFQDARRSLVAELAVEPGPALRELEQLILRQDASLHDAGESAARGWVSEPGSGEPGDSGEVQQSESVSPTDRQSGDLLRKTATVLVARFMPGHADPEMARTAVGVAREEADRIVVRHGGTLVSGLGGDGVGIFGLPLINEDDAMRALRAAHDLRSCIETINARSPCEMVVRIGVDTGEVVGLTPDDIFGEPLSRAVFLMEGAENGEVLLSDATRRSTLGSVTVAPALGGGAWRLEDVTPPSSASQRWCKSPMVNRVSELGLIRAAVAGVATRAEGRLLTVVGEAGIGKSRLINELLDQLPGQAVLLSGRCLSYGEGIAFWPLREALAEFAGGDSRDAIRALLDDAEDADVIADVVAATFGVSDSTALSEQVPWAFRRLLEVLALRGPLVLTIDDLHWAKAALLDLLEYLVDWVTAPILLLGGARPELLDARPAWGGGHPRVHSLVLGPLSDEDTLSLIDHRSGQRPLAVGDRPRILEAAEGNPLFVEHLLAMSAQDPLWNDKREIPATLQAVLAARLDRLGPGERAFVQRAAIIGHDFSLAAVVDLLPDEARATAERHSRTLVHRGFIQPHRSQLGDGEQLRFHHILLRDVAYRSTPKALRCELHERFATWLAAHGDAYDEFVGYHLAQAFRHRTEIGVLDDERLALAERAGTHLAAAGRRATSRGDARAAVGLLGEAAEMFGAADIMRPEVALDFGTALGEFGDLRRAEDELHGALEQARAVGADAVAARAMIELSDLHGLVDSTARVDETEDVARRAIAVFKRLGDENGLARAWLHLADIHWTRCSFAQMEKVLEQALRHAETAGDPRDRSRILSHFARAAALGPRPVDDAISRCNAILTRGEGDLHLTALTQTMLAVLEAMQGRSDAARARWEATTRRLADVGLDVTVSLLQIYRALIELLSERPVNVAPDLAQACTVLQAMGEQSRMASIAALLARLLYINAQYEQSEYYGRTSETAASPDDVASHVIWQGTNAKLIARAGDTRRAEEVANRAVDIAARTDFLMLHADTLRDRSEVLTLLDCPDRAMRDLELAIALYERKGICAPAAAARASRRSLATANAHRGTTRRADRRSTGSR